MESFIVDNDPGLQSHSRLRVDLNWRRDCAMLVMVKALTLYSTFDGTESFIPRNAH